MCGHRSYDEHWNNCLDSFSLSFSSFLDPYCVHIVLSLLPHFLPYKSLNYVSTVQHQGRKFIILQLDVDEDAIHLILSGSNPGREIDSPTLYSSKLLRVPKFINKVIFKACLITKKLDLVFESYFGN